jgi:hypothetical protein
MSVNNQLVFMGSMAPGQWWTSQRINQGERWDCVCVSHNEVIAHNARRGTKYDPEGWEAMTLANFRQWTGWKVCTEVDFGMLYINTVY